MKILVSLAVVIVLLFSSCAKNAITELSAEQKATIQKEVIDQFNKVTSAIDQLDSDIYSQCLSKEGFISHISTTRGITYGYDAHLDTIKVSFARRTRHQSQQLDLNVYPLTSDLALVTRVAIWENWYKDGRYRKSNGKATYLFKKEQAGWKVIHINEGGTLIEETNGNL